MNAEDLLEAIGEAQDGYVLDAREPPKQRISVLSFCASVAACLCLILSLAWILPRDIPDYPDAIISAAQLAALFTEEYYGTNQYDRVCVPSDEYLRLYEIPETEALPVYRYYRYDDSADLTPSDEEREAFITKSLSNFCSALEIPIPDEETSYQNDVWSIRPQDGPYWFSAFANDQRYYFSLDLNVNADVDDLTVRLNGHAVQIDQRQTDQEILTSLEDVKAQLFEIFGVSFSDAKIIRHYDGCGDQGVEYLMVFYYDEDAHPINAARDLPETDRIQLIFRHMVTYEGRQAEDLGLLFAEVIYSDYHRPPEEECTQFTTGNMISLKEAEAMLYNDYVFGKGCPKCMTYQDRVSFRGYDHVGFEYLNCHNEASDTSYAFPFYAFYKDIGTAENGQTIYARTYVPAIEVSDIEGYFRNHQKYH